MNSSVAMDGDFLTWILLHQTTDVLVRARDKEVKQFGISAMESATLFIIQAFGEKVIPADIARWLFREHHTVSALLGRMEKRGLIIKTRDPNKKNIWRISLTEKGRKAYSKSTKRQAIHAAMSGLSKSERQRLGSYLKKVRDQTLKYLRTEPTFPFP